MGFFSTSPKSKSELKAYEKEKAVASKVYAVEVRKARLEQVKKQARFDALPRTERARQRVQKGVGLFKTGVAKFKAVDAKLEARAKAEGQSGGLIQQGYRQDRMNAASNQPFIQRSLQGPQGEGLIIQSLKGPAPEVKVVYRTKRRRR
jgi:hypothetical protein